LQVRHTRADFPSAFPRRSGKNTIGLD